MRERVKRVCGRPKLWLGLLAVSFIVTLTYSYFSSETPLAERKSSFLFLSFPKSGRTWLKYIVVSALAHHFRFNITPTEILRVQLPTTNGTHTIPRVLFSHFKGNVETSPRQKWTLASLKGLNVVFLVRDPRDVVVSNYFEKAFRDCSWAKALKINRSGQKNCYPQPRYQLEESESDTLANRNETKTVCSCFPSDFTVRDFLYSPVGGFNAILQYNALYLHNCQKYAAKCIVIHYENLQRTGVEELSKILSFLLQGAKVEASTIKSALEESSFENMRNLELSQQGPGVLRPKDSADNVNSFKTREGKIGDYFRYFTSEDIEWMNKKMLQVLPKELGYS